MKTRTILLVVFFLRWITTGWTADHVKGDGESTSEKISVADHSEARMDGVTDFNYEQSDDPSTVEATVNRNLHPYVNIEVKDRVLTIAFKGTKVDHFTKFIARTSSKWLTTAEVSGDANFMVNNPLTGDETVIKVSASSLVQLKETVTVGRLDLNVSGSANMVVNHLEADKIECNIDGSGSITVKKGSVKEGDHSIISSGDIHAFGLVVPQLSCKVTGNGLTEVHATNNLKANVVGKGSIRYKGPTAIQQRITGKGTMERVKE